MVFVGIDVDLFLSRGKEKDIVVVDGKLDFDFAQGLFRELGKFLPRIHPGAVTVDHEVFALPWISVMRPFESCYVPGSAADESASTGRSTTTTTTAHPLQGSSKNY
jgi:hypothetical protein